MSGGGLVAVVMRESLVNGGQSDVHRLHHFCYSLQFILNLTNHNQITVLTKGTGYLILVCNFILRWFMINLTVMIAMGCSVKSQAFNCSNHFR